MNRNHHISLTIRQAHKWVFEPILSDKAIFKWIADGIFRPSRYVSGPAIRGEGSQLDLADLVTIGLLHGLFASGVRFEHMNIEGEKFPTGHMEFEGVANPHTLGPRPIQTYLEQANYKVHVAVQVVRPLDMGDGRPVIHVGEGGRPRAQTISTIYVFPTPSLEKYTDPIGALQPYERHVFINVRYWYQFVTSRLRTIS
jgi:hypothetical protein